MLWKKFNQFWNDISLQKKLVSLILMTVLLFLFLFSCIVFVNVNDFTRRTARMDMEKTFLSADNALHAKIDRIDNASMLISSNPSIENVLQGSYFSVYSFYYDLKYQFDSTITALKFICPEILSIDLYLKELSDNMTRGTFHSFDSLQSIHPELDFSSLQSPQWICDTRNIHLFRKLFNSYSYDSYAIVEISIDYNSLFSDLLPPAIIDNYEFEITDASGRLLFRQTDRNTPVDPASSNLMRVSKTNACGWTLSLCQPTPTIPLSSLASNRDMFVLVFAFTMVMLILRFLITKTIVLRISNLNRYVSDVVDNNFMEEIHCSDRDEIGNITRNVNNMTQRTHELIDKVYNSQILQKEAEIKMLQAQINPHFLYNTLSVLNWKALKYEDLETSQLITDLSAFYRAALNVSSLTTTIGEEIEFIRRYLRIRQATCPHRITTDISVPEPLMDFELPHIILQPIVENAVDHGIEALPQNEEGFIRVTATEMEDEIIITITDNGPGMDDEQLANVLQPKTHGYGLYNVNERLKLFFDQVYGLHLANAHPSGLAVTVHIPKYVSLF